MNHNRKMGHRRGACAMKKVLCVCLGNICRSPAAEGALKAKAAERGLPLFVDSAGTGAWHTGARPDNRMIQCAARRRYDLTNQRARQVDLADFYEFDYVLAMDESNLGDLLAMAPPNRECDVRLFLDFGDTKDHEVPDPYYGGHDGFERVLSLIENAADGFLDHIERESEAL